TSRMGHPTIRRRGIGGSHGAEPSVGLHPASPIRGSPLLETWWGSARGLRRRAGFDSTDDGVSASRSALSSSTRSGETVPKVVDGVERGAASAQPARRVLEGSRQGVNLAALRHAEGVVTLEHVEDGHRGAVGRAEGGAIVADVIEAAGGAD